MNKRPYTCLLMLCRFAFHRYPRKATLYTLFLIAIWPAETTHSQDWQLWLDGFAYQTIGTSLEYEGNIGASKLLEEEGWGEVYLTNTLSWQVKPWYMVEGSLELHYTSDPKGPEIIEVRPFIGQKFTFSYLIKPIHLERPYFYMRLDQRFFNYPEEDTAYAKTRLRLRLGGRFILNNTILEKGTFYVPFFFEGFFNFNGEAFERFASRSMTQVGLGYVVNARCRTELVYYLQRSRDTIEDDFARTGNIAQVLVRYYFR